MTRVIQIIPTVDATRNDGSIVIGRHALWLPKEQIKIPFQWGGRITKYAHREEETDVRDTLPHEIAILSALAGKHMAPPVIGLVYVENLITEHPGGWHCDPCGAWGYKIADANRLPAAPGHFSIAAMRELPIKGSEGAWGDVEKPGNVVNGFLVDVRRTAWDMLKWAGDPAILPAIPDVRENPRSIERDVHRLCQFPQGEREHAYQDFYLDGEWRRGERRVTERADLLDFRPRPGESVLEIGCQSGGFLQHAWMQMDGKGTVLGVEIDPDYVDCARRLARHAQHNICVRQMDAVKDMNALVSWVRKRVGNLDHLLLLSMEKHLGHDRLFELVDRLAARRTYIETNAVAKDSGEGPEPKGPMKLWDEVRARKGVHVGNSRDRNLRRLYKISRP